MKSSQFNVDFPTCIVIIVEVGEQSPFSLTLFIVDILYGRYNAYVTTYTKKYKLSSLEEDTIQ